MEDKFKGKRFYLRTFGCQMNDRDSELVAGLLIKAGYKLAQSADEADIVLFNTCSVRQRAEDKVWSEIGKLKLLKSEGRKTKDAKNKNIPRPSEEQYDERSSLVTRKIIGLLGCMAENYQQLVFKKSPLVDIVIGPNNISGIAQVLDEFFRRKEAQISVGKAQRLPQAYNSEYLSDKHHANVIIMEGCDNYCSYCIVPYVRGRERSRKAEDIINEIKEMIKKGVKEITLLGQNVNSYRSQAASCKLQVKSENQKKENSLKPGTSHLQHETCNLQPVTFMNLLRMVNGIEGLKIFDFVTSHPKDANSGLFKTMAELSKCKKSLHLPVQSGSDRILKKMNRGYTRKHYIDLVKKAKKIIPGIRLTTDIMVGFPGETEKDFQDTFDLMKKVEFDAAYIFKYSPRPQTKALEFSDDVSVEIKKQRHQILLNFQKQLHKRKTN